MFYNSWIWLALYDLVNEVVQFGQNFDLKIRRDDEQKFLWAPRLWVCRRKKPILGYISKIYGKNNSGHKGLSNNIPDIISQFICTRINKEMLVVQTHSQWITF